MNEKMTVNGTEYEILKLLGKGKGGYSYLADDGTQKYVLKQIHHEPCDYYQFGNKIQSEINDYNRLKEIGIKLPAMVDVDIKNERILKEFIDGSTIYELILQDKMLPSYVSQLQSMCALLYAAHTNIDYFPTNFVVQDGELYYIDFECNEYMEEWNFENWGVKYWSKTPEFMQYVKEHSPDDRPGAAACGDAQALFELAMKHIYGDGVPEDNELAAKLLTQSQEMGHVEAAYNLGICYHYGFGVDVDLGKAFALYLESANAGYGKGMELIGRFYNRGIHVERDREKAEFWLRKAMKSSDPDAAAGAQKEFDVRL